MPRREVAFLIYCNISNIGLCYTKIYQSRARNERRNHQHATRVESMV